MILAGGTTPALPRVRTFVEERKPCDHLQFWRQRAERPLNRFGDIVGGSASRDTTGPRDQLRFFIRESDPGCIEVVGGASPQPVAVELTDAIMPGVVSIPHGWGHDAPGVRLDVARRHAGVNSNVLADESQVDPLSGNAGLNGIPVELAPVRA